MAMVQTPLPESLAQVSVQIVFSGGLDMDEKNLYAAVLAPFALGIPSGQVQLYCSNRFLAVIPQQWRTTAQLINQTINNDTAVLPDDDYGVYFAEIHGRAQNAVAPLPNCSLRFICGHGYGGGTSGGHVRVRCGADALMQVKDFATHASVLTVLDMCNAPNAVHGIIKGGSGATTVPAAEEEVFDNLAFPLVSTKSSVTHCFRVSCRNGHNKAVSVDDNNRYKPDEFLGMTDSIGFPSMASLLAAVDSYVNSNKNRPLGDLFQEQYLSIDTRYAYYGSTKKMPMETPHHDLDKLQSLFDNQVVVPRAEAFNCVFFSRRGEWFLTGEELVTSLPSTEH